MPNDKIHLALEQARQQGEDGRLKIDRGGSKWAKLTADSKRKIKFYAARIADGRIRLDHEQKPAG